MTWRRVSERKEPVSVPSATFFVYSRAPLKRSFVRLPRKADEKKFEENRLPLLLEGTISVVYEKGKRTSGMMYYLFKCMF